MTVQITTDQELEAVLTELGATPDDVEATLLSADCRGKRLAAGGCPVANWLFEHVERLEDVSVCADNIRIWVWLDNVAPYPLACRPPAAVSTLITEFDTERRPHLIEPPSTASEVPS